MEVGTAIEHAVARLEPSGRLAASQPLAGGSSAVVHRLDVATPGGGTRRVVFRQLAGSFKGARPEALATERRLLAALHRLGFPVPEPLLGHDGDHEAEPYLVTEWVEGSTAISGAELPGALDQMAAFLARLHELDPQATGLPELPDLEDPAEAVHPYLPATATGRRVRAALDHGMPRAPNRPAVVHGDYWPGNVIWRAGRLAAVVDWEDVSLGDPLADLACARVELCCQHGNEAMEQLTASYLAQRGRARQLRLDDLALWEVYVSASALATMHDWGLEPADERRRRQATSRFLDRAARQLGPG